MLFRWSQSTTTGMLVKSCWRLLSLMRALTWVTAGKTIPACGVTLQHYRGHWRSGASTVLPEVPLVLATRNFLHLKLHLGSGAGVEDHDDLDENADPDTKLQLTEQTDKKAGKPGNEINLWVEEISLTDC